MNLFRQLKKASKVDQKMCMKNFENFNVEIFLKSSNFRSSFYYVFNSDDHEYQLYFLIRSTDNIFWHAIQNFEKFRVKLHRV